MATFGIIAEGITDQYVIENILRGFFADAAEEPVVNYVQPPLDATARGGQPEPRMVRPAARRAISGRILRLIAFGFATDWRY